MRVFFTSGFKKRFEKLPQKIQRQFEKRLELFIKEPNNPVLYNHPLRGTLIGFRSFSVTGDYRVMYRIIEIGSVKLVDIGTHSQMYG